MSTPGMHIKELKQSKLILFDAGGHAMLSQIVGVKGYIREFLKDIPTELPVRPYLRCTLQGVLIIMEVRT